MMLKTQSMHQVNLRVKKILKNFSKATILRPSIVYSVDDNFTTNFMTLLSLLPIFPIYYSGKTKFMPIHCSDLVDIIYKVILNNMNSNIIECVGPETITFKEIIKKILNHIDKKRILLPMPLPLAIFVLKVFSIISKTSFNRGSIKTSKI